MTSQECSICCELFGDKKIFSCPNCCVNFCITCQKRYQKGECINCHMQFNQKFITKYLGKTFIEKVLKSKLIEELMKKQKETLRYVQPLVDWEKEVREQKKKLRFGIPMEIQPRPTISKKNDDIVFPCPKTGCRGFVSKYVCGTCKCHICPSCHEEKKDGHVCDTNNLKTIALLTQDSKQCPRCCVTIQRTHGCDHMYCTNCQTHFDWKTLDVLATSTNGHYLGLSKFSNDVVTRDITPNRNNERCGFSLVRGEISENEIQLDIFDKNVSKCIWIDSNTIRLIKRKRYDEEVIISENDLFLQEEQVKYLLGDIDESLWSKRVYQQYMKKTRSLLYSNVLNIYLSLIDKFQNDLSMVNTENNSNQKYMPILTAQDTVMKQYCELVALCNQSFQSIYEEYGGPLHHIREPSEDLDAPSFI